MNINKIFKMIALLLIIIVSEVYSENEIIHINQEVRLKPLSDNVWIHTSDIKMPQWGKVSANGLAIITDNWKW
jgi:hypothetical protein